MSCGNHHDTDCSQVLSRLYEYLDQEVGELDCAKIKQHLDECGPCLQHYDLDRALKAIVKRSCSPESAPEALRRRILARITQAKLEYES